MRIAVISDVHGNCQALEAVLGDIARAGADLVVNLGDMLSGPMEPARCADLLMARDFPSVRGNHDRLLLDAPDRIDTFAASRLSAHHRDWLAQLPATRVVEGEIFLCHGTPGDDLAPWLDNWWQAGRTTRLPSEAEVAAEAEGLAFPVLLCGHTHLPRAVRLADGRLVLNPGSVGLQMTHGAPDARYALVERINGVWAPTFRMVPYDHEAAGRIAAENGFPKWQAALRSGWPTHEGLF